jgi:hypothetical protein
MECYYYVETYPCHSSIKIVCILYEPLLCLLSSSIFHFNLDSSKLDGEHLRKRFVQLGWKPASTPQQVMCRLVTYFHILYSCLHMLCCFEF